MTPGPVDPARHTFRSPKFASVVQEAVQFLSNTPVHSLPPLTTFPGVGVYALYYFGSFELYDYLTALNQKDYVQPIYMGKAVPRGWRTARTLSTEVNSRELYGRLREHARSIEEAHNLEVKDFCCRFMILNNLESDLISAAEAALIRQYKPLWNTVVHGFGNHAPGSGRPTAAAGIRTCSASSHRKRAPRSAETSSRAPWITAWNISSRLLVLATAEIAAARTLVSRVRRSRIWPSNSVSAASWALVLLIFGAILSVPSVGYRVYFHLSSPCPLR